MFSLREHDHLSVKVETPVFEETGTPLYIPWSSSFSGPVQKEPTSVTNLGDPRVTVRNTPPSHSPRAPHSSMTLQPVQLPRGRADPPRAVPVVTFGAPPEDQMSITASEGERCPPGIKIWLRCPLRVWQRCPSPTQRWLLCFSGPPQESGSSGTFHRLLRPCGWTIGFLGWPVLVLRAPPQYLSYQKCMRKWINRGWHLFLPEAGLDGGLERSVAMQLCPKTAPFWQGNLRLHFRACKFSSSLAGKAYTACGEATSALHAMVFTFPFWLYLYNLLCDK